MMIGSHMICNHQRATDLHAQQLQHQLVTVDRTEAEAGASQSDQVRLAAKRNEQEDQLVPYSTYYGRAVAFAGQLKSRKNETTQTPEESCPVAKARGESQIGSNVPLEWLIADSYGGSAEAGAFGPALSAGSEDSISSREAAPLKGSDAESFSPSSASVDAPSTEEFTTNSAAIETSSESGGTLLGQEWLLSPLA